MAKLPPQNQPDDDEFPLWEVEPQKSARPQGPVQFPEELGYDPLAELVEEDDAGNGGRPEPEPDVVGESQPFHFPGGGELLRGELEPSDPIPEAVDMAGYQPSPKSRWGLLVGLAALVLFVFLVLPFTPLAKKTKRGILDVADRISPGKTIIRRDVPIGVPIEVIREVPVEVVREVEVEVIKEIEIAFPMPVVPPSSEDNLVPYRRVDLGSLFNGIRIRSEIEAVQGVSATDERDDLDSYGVEFRVRLSVPKPTKTLAGLSRLNPALPKALPGLGGLLKSSRISPFFHLLYEEKAADIRKNLTQLETLLSRHNYYDCETILELRHPSTGRRALFIQAEMDVVADGSDGDRMPKLDDYISMSKNYQPFTSYGWKKTSKTANPLLSRWQTKLANAKKSKASSAEIKKLKLGIADMKKRSFLIAEADPFMVLSLSMFGYEKNNPYGPTVGDYAVIIHGDDLYPCIVGDAGPFTKIGEASLRVAKQIDPESTPYRRPVSDLKVSYLVFPQSAEKPFRAPNLSRWRTKCQGLIDQIGGLGKGYDLHRWSDPFAKAVVSPVTSASSGGTTN